ncbi:MAG: ferredoxin [Frankia sp.]|nr:ferredoxin [Frankia sp.]
MERGGVTFRVDREACTGSGSCVFHAPETFDQDDELKVVVLDEGGDPASAVTAAVESCPSGALRLASAAPAARPNTQGEAR